MAQSACRSPTREGGVRHSKNAEGFNQDVLPLGRQVQQTRNHHRVERSVPEWQRRTGGRNGGDSLGCSLAAQDVEHFF
jgi:hypothetical protein